MSRVSDAEEIECRDCKVTRPRSEFHKSDLEASKYRCRCCVKKANAAYFAANGAVHLACEIRRREKAQFGASAEEAQVITADFITTTVALWDRRDYVTGDTGVKVLTLIRADGALPLGPTNAVPVARRTATLLKNQLPPQLRVQYQHDLSVLLETKEKTGAVASPANEALASSTPPSPRPSSRTPARSTAKVSMRGVPAATAPPAAAVPPPTSRPRVAAPSTTTKRIRELSFEDFWAAKEFLPPGLVLKGANLMGRFGKRPRLPSPGNSGEAAAGPHPQVPDFVTGR